MTRLLAVLAALALATGCAGLGGAPGITGTLDRLKAPLATWDACAQNGRGFELYVRVEAPRLYDVAARVAAGEAVGGGEIVTYGCDGTVQKTLQIDPEALRQLLQIQKEVAP